MHVTVNYSKCMKFIKKSSYRISRDAPSRGGISTCQII